MQIYDMASRRMFSQIAAYPIWYENFEQKGAAYMPVFTVTKLVRRRRIKFIKICIRVRHESEQHVDRPTKMAW